MSKSSADTALRFLEARSKREAREKSPRKLHRREYRSWIGAKERCFNPGDKDFALYGGCGITVCERWRDSFENFLADMGERPPGLTLDRLDNDGNYEPGNCRWATRAQQSRNTSRTKLTPELVVRVRRAIAAGWGIVDVARELGVPPGVITCVNTGRTWKDV